MPEVTAYEQYMLELINAERAKVGAQPLAFDTDLNEAADAHSGWMIGADRFSHTGSGGSNAGQRMTAAGYLFSGSWGWGENIAWATTRNPTGLQDEVSLLHSNLMNSSGHRANILNSSYREVGLGLQVGDYGGREGAFVTQDFARSGSTSILTGVAFDDRDGDRFYDPGEGLGGIAVTIRNSAGNIVATTTTMEAGGYDLQLAAGTYAVTFSGAGFAPTTKQVTIGSQNVKLDLIDPSSSTSGSTAPPPLPSAPEPAPSDTITGTASAERLYGTASDDDMHGQGGSDQLYGLAGNDTINGGTGNDYLSGAAGNDTLIGGDGRDRLNGGAGFDTLTGGAGSDTFVFDATLNSTTNVDRITDFSTVYDLIQLENAVFTRLTSTGTLASSAFKNTGAGAVDSSDRIIYDKATGALSYDVDGSGGGVAVQFAQLAPGLALTAQDFVIT